MLKNLFIMVEVKAQIYSKYSHPAIVLDNALPHTVNYTKKIIQRHFNLLYVPLQSPGLNPIEKVF